jgi:hypothetical protein
MMKTFLSTLVLTTTLTSIALAGEPVTLTEAQLDTIAAGGGKGKVGDSDPVAALGRNGGMDPGGMDLILPRGSKPAMGSEDGD